MSIQRSKVRVRGLFFMAIAVALCGGLGRAAGGERAAFWVDLALGEPVSQEEMIEDLMTCDVVYLGETHRLERHHRLQLEILRGLAASGRPMLLGLEQVESSNQESLDRFNRGEIGFEALAEAIQWKEQWTNYQDYRETIEAAREHGVRVVALNAPHEVIRLVGRGGVSGLSDEDRKTLPESIYLEDPVYEKLMNKLLQVHSTMDPKFLRNVFEAQASRDESMAAALVAGLKLAGENSKGGALGVVIAGAGHVQFGLGTPDRVRRRLPDLTERIVLMSESGDLVLTPQEEAMRRALELVHSDLHFIRRPLADYLHVKEAAPDEKDTEFK